ncbi:MAG TPA: ATP-dependent DNA ligase [Chthoniobacterales bacterium]|nr:ATP-dependent DNA ligase [Chthoniobacterales bacterium]
MIEVRYERGVYLPAQDLWLDPWDAQRFAFVSHAHSDHIAPHGEIILSEKTARLMRSRMPGERKEHIVPFGEKQTIRGITLTLLPAGHIFGSAQILIESGADSLLYTGDFKLRQGRSAEPAEWKHAETLIMETTYGLPRYRLPPTEQVVNQIVSFCHETIDDGGVPVLLGYSLGKAQEILCSLTGAGLTPMLHGSVYEMTKIYEQFGQNFCEYVRYRAGDVAGKVLICPPSANRSRMLEKIPRKRVAMISGWAVDPNAIYRYQVDAAFPLSDHADYTDLIRYVELVQPGRVLTLHGFAAEFARDLRERGVEAWALTQENQMELGLGTLQSANTDSRAVLDELSQTPAPAETVPPPATPAIETASEFRKFAEVGEAIAAVPAKLEKIRLLAEYLRSLTDDQLPIATIYFTGKAFAQSDPRTLQVGWSVTFRALQAATKISRAEFHRIAHTHGDAGKSAFDVLDRRTRPERFTILESRELFDSLHRARGPIAKAELLQNRFEKVSALEGAYLVKILTGDLRIGLREGLVEEAIAKAFELPFPEVQEANMLLGDVGATAVLASRNELNRAELSLFRPIKSMLASPEPTAEAIWQRFVDEHASAEDNVPEDHAPTVFVEDKFDGIRAQLHRSTDRVEIFSRDLRRITDQFPELTEQAAKLDADVILDGEIVAFAEGRKLTFFDLQKRLGRKNEGADLFAAPTADVPVSFVAFDLLWLNGRSVLRSPLKERRQLLRSVAMPPQFQVAEVFPAQSAAEIEDIFRQARRRANEGLMIKDPDSAYSPGRRGMYWFKLKKELATLDVVVVAAELGHGKRNHVLSDYTFAVRDEETGDLLPIGKAYSGLTDVEIAELTEHFKQNTLVDEGRYREVKPDIVLEVAFNSIQPSRRHASGLALRFPRIKAIRRDKTVDTIDTLTYARELAEQYAGNSHE